MTDGELDVGLTLEGFIVEHLIQAQVREENLDLVSSRLKQLVLDEETALIESRALLENFQAQGDTMNYKTESLDLGEDSKDEENKLKQYEIQLQSLRQTLLFVEDQERNCNLAEISLGKIVEHSSGTNTEIESEINCLRILKDTNQRKLENLIECSALNESIFISHEGLFGTINGLRLGTLPTEQVQWTEINAAWGLAALLLDYIAQEIGFNFFIWKVLPRGSQSLMVNVQNSSQSLNLFCNTSWLWKSSFNAGITAFADCVDELSEFAKREDPGNLLPYKIEKSTIAGLSLHYSDSLSWTRAMKFLLTDLKWLEIWIGKRNT